MSGSTYRIFAIDDIVDNLFLLQTFLEVEGFSVEVADRAKTALQRIETDPPDLILLDIMMPDMSGYEVVQRIRQNSQLASVPIILISANDRTQALQGLALGANDFVQKPIDLEELQTKVKGALQSAKAAKISHIKGRSIHPATRASTSQASSLSSASSQY